MMEPPASMTAEGEERSLVEVGWIVVGPVDPVDLEAARLARGDMQALLAELFPEFEWRLPFVRRREAPPTSPPEPVDLLEIGARERDALRLDFAFVLTEADLKAYYKAYALGVPSKAMNVAVVSTARIDPQMEGGDQHQGRVDRLRRRILALSLHLFGHLNDLGHTDQTAAFMYEPKAVTDLDEMTSYSDAHQEALRSELRDEADVRLEESASWRGRTGVFYARAAWHRGGDILQTVFRAQPWLFPLRLSRLTTAALSALLVLLTTAEAWDLGMSQSPAFVLVLSLVVLLVTVIFILKRQRLLIRQHQRRLSEQRVISNVSTVISVLTGMATTYALLFVGILIIANTVFPDDLVSEWAASLDGQVSGTHYLVLAAFVASLGLSIGALGASFEATSYFRHITYVDEET